MSSIFGFGKNKSNNNTPRNITPRRTSDSGKSPRVEDIKEDTNPKRISPRVEVVKTSKSKRSPRKNSLKNSNPETKISRHLIYDRFPANRMILKEYIHAFGGIVTEVESSNDVIEHIKTYGEYNIIWMDIPMPELDSLECIDYLRKELKYTGPIIGLIGYTDDQTRELCYKVDISHLVTKPYDMNSINAYIEKYS